MALRTADQYKEGLKDNRDVYIMGKRVADVTQDPYMKVGVETAAFDFMPAHDPEHREISVMKSPNLDEEISAHFEVCTIHAEGSPAAQKKMLLAEAPSESYKRKAKEIIGLNV